MESFLSRGVRRFKEASLPDAVQVLLASQQELTVADGGGGPEDFVVEAIGRDQLEFAAGFDEGGGSGIVQQKQAVDGSHDSFHL